jgi:hypothetical protein
VALIALGAALAKKASAIGSMWAKPMLLHDVETYRPEQADLLAWGRSWRPP